VIGAFIAFLSACLQGINSACLRRGVLNGSASQAMAITVPLGVPVTLLAAWVSGQLYQLDDLSRRGVLFLAAAGVLQYSFARYWNYRATAALGSVGAGPVQQLQMWVAVMMAVVLLDETLTPLKLLGMSLIFVSPLIIAVSIRRRNKRHAKQADTDQPIFKPQILMGYVSAMIAALAYGASPVLIRSGLEGTNLGIAGALIAYSCATLVFALFSSLVPGQIRHIRQTDRRAVSWYALAGLVVSVAQSLYFMALSLAPVTVVAPIHQFSLIARVCAGYVINRQHEVLTPTVILGVLLSLIGTVILTADWQGIG
jgi:uncharacterized membrane protein